MISDRYVLFLDVDGVINSDRDIKVYSYDYICPEKVKLVKHIVDKYNCYVVLSSMWRLKESDRNKVKSYIDFDDVTTEFEADFSVSSNKIRQTEILEYIANHNLSVDKCIVLDDMDIYYKKLQPFVIDSSKGITLEDLNLILEHYNAK